MKHYSFIISDYENSGDLDWARQHALLNFPNIKNIKTWEDRDYEAEFYYKEDYGECSEPIYQGYIEFDAPDEYVKELDSFSF